MTQQPSERHLFVYCAPDGLSEGTIDTPDAQNLAVIADWIRAGRPLIARMRRDQDAAGWVALGLPLPLEFGKKRITLSVKPQLVQAVAPPPLLSDVIGILPPQWRARLERLCMDLTSHTASVRVVGSLAWQSLTGAIYLHPRSDVDVVIHAAGIAELKPLLGILADSDLSPGPRIDGEIVSPRGEAASWRELISSNKDILIKEIRGPRIALREEWLSALREHAI